jgi:hypothetical protein
MPEELKARPARERKLRIHYLVRREGGPIKSSQGGSTFPVGTRSEWAFACDGAMPQSLEDRGTTEPYLVQCAECGKLLSPGGALEKEMRPHPSDPSLRRALDTADEGCCG